MMKLPSMVLSKFRSTARLRTRRSSEEGSSLADDTDLFSEGDLYSDDDGEEDPDFPEKKDSNPDRRGLLRSDSFRDSFASQAEFHKFLDLCDRPAGDRPARSPEPAGPRGPVGDTGCPLAPDATAPAAASTGGCPFRHGTVYSGPYPGYAHGNPRRGICPRGCRPASPPATESPRDTLLREAAEFLELYYHERGGEVPPSAASTKEERMEQVRRSVRETGTYEHTFDELQHGARVAWRNAPKCSNRKFWGQLKLLDCRDVTTNRGMFDRCIRHLAKAVSPRECRDDILPQNSI